jgi:hypothetical protein
MLKTMTQYERPIRAILTQRQYDEMPDFIRRILEGATDRLRVPVRVTEPARIVCRRGMVSARRAIAIESIEVTQQNNQRV